MQIYNPFKVDIPNKELRIAYNRNYVESTFNKELSTIQTIENQMTLILIGYLILAYALMNSLFVTHLLISFTALVIIYGVMYKIFTNQNGVHSVVNFHIKKNLYYTVINALLTHALLRKILSLGILLHLGEKLYSTNFYKLYLLDFPAHIFAGLILFIIIQLDFYFNHLRKYRKLDNMLCEACSMEEKQHSLLEETDKDRQRNEKLIKEIIDRQRVKKSTNKVIDLKIQNVRRRMRTTNTDTQDLNNKNN